MGGPFLQYIEMSKAPLAPKPKAARRPAESESQSDSAESPSDQESASNDSGSEESAPEAEDSDEADLASELDSGSDSDMPKKKRKANDGGAFASAFNAIVGSKLKAYDRAEPILARNKSTLKRLESEKLEAKARRMLHDDRKAKQERFRVKNLLPSATELGVRETIEKERHYKKVAQRGVVKLFNAIMATQSSAKDGALTLKEVNEVTKLQFLDLVKAAGQDS